MADSRPAEVIENPWLPAEIQTLPAEMRRLPLGVQAWYIYETDYLSRIVDDHKLRSPEFNEQDPFYAPEAKNIFDLLGVWIPENQLQVFKSSRVDLQIREEFTRQTGNGKEYLFLIHPESMDLYEEILQKNYERETFRAVATASSRSLLIWKRGDESRPMIGKVSLNKEVGESLRTIKGTEAASSMGVSMTLGGTKDLPENILIMDETMSMIPVGMERGAMILRSFPPEFFSGKTQFFPLFALYGDKNPGLLLNLLKRAKTDPAEYVRAHIIAPFVKLWAKMAVDQGILLEPHAQNILMEMSDGELTDRFGLRDFGGFNIDFELRKRRSQFVPAELPNFTGDLNKDYYQQRHIENIRKGLNIYFEGGFLYNVQRAMNTWAKNGLIARSSEGKYNLSKILLDELSLEFSQRLNRKVKIREGYAGLRKAVLEAREPQLSPCVLSLLPE
ncbi:MAG: IucA/IucC family C-terminal-domain containing protein [Bdellovibrionales bacterium]